MIEANPSIRTTCIGVALALACSVSAQAQPRTDNGVWWTEGDWSVIGYPSLKACMLRYRPDNGVSLAILKASFGPSELRMTVRDGSEPPPTGEAASFWFDGTALPAAQRSTPQGVMFGLFAQDQRPIVAFAKAQVMQLRVGERILAEVPLTNIPHALDQTRDCAAQWPNGFVPTLQPHQAIPEPDLAGPFAPYLPPRAIAQHLWIRSEDYPLRSIREREEGSTGVRIRVSPVGWVQSCEVIASSGYASLDAATCTILTIRARWQPATDLIGMPTVSSVTIRITWKIPEDSELPEQPAP